jgi:hypothetical protein
LPRINIAKEFTWKSGTWYHTKLSVETKLGVVKAKVWPKGEPEPAEWTIEFTDPMPNTGGAAALYGYISNAEADSPGGEIYYDNVMITPLKK